MRWSDEHDGFWDVADDAGCRAVAGARTGFTSHPHVHIPPSGLAQRGIRIYALESEGEAHRTERAVLRDGVGPAAVARLEGLVVSVARRLLGQLDWHETVDLAGPYAYRLPLEVIATIAGVPDELVAELRAHTNTLLFRHGTTDAALAAADRVTDIAAATIAARRRTPRGDWLDQLIDQLPEDGEVPVESDAVRAVVAIITGGHHSTSRAIGSILARVYADPALRDLLVAEPERIADAAEETLRLHTPLPSFSRTAYEDTDVGGVPVSSGQRALLHYDTANRDPDVYADPDRFDLERRAHAHLAFGWGAHRCVGMHLARAEMKIAVQEALRAIPDGVLAAPIRWIGPAEPDAVLLTRPLRLGAQQ